MSKYREAFKAGNIAYYAPAVKTTAEREEAAAIVIEWLAVAMAKATSQEEVKVTKHLSKNSV